MKYIIDRSLSYDGAPIEEARLEPIHHYDYRRKDINDRPNVWSDFCERCRDIIIEPDGDYRGTCKMSDNVWIAEVADLHKFVKQYGTIILFEPDNEEGLWKIEIYDGYRE